MIAFLVRRTIVNLGASSTSLIAFAVMFNFGGIKSYANSVRLPTVDDLIAQDILRQVINALATSYFSVWL